MKKPLVLLIFALAVGFIFSTRLHRRALPAQDVSQPISQAATDPAPPGSAPAPESAPRETESQRRARMISATANRDDFKLSEQDVYAYLETTHTNALGLITAFEATQDKEFLKRAAQAFPNDPFVQTKVLLHDVFPEDRAKWVEALKQSSPGNSLPHLLAAVDAMKQGDSTKALAELAASEQKSFNDFTRLSSQGLEEAYLGAGRSIGDAKTLAKAEVTLPHIAPFKSLGQQITELAKQAAASGDIQAQQQLLQRTWQIGNQLRRTDEPGPLITELTGLALENISLQNWPQGSLPPFLTRPIADQLAVNQQFRSELQQTAKVYDAWYPNASESELIAYMDRAKTFGERDAMKWLLGRHPELAQSVPAAR